MGPDDNRHSLHPNAVEAERALLGGLIQRPDVLEEIRRDLDASDFWRDDHRLLFTLLMEMKLNGEAIDLITIPERVLRTGEPGKYGGIAYVIELPEHAPSTVNLEHYAGLIRSKSMLRQLMTLGNELTTHASRHPDDVNGLLDKTTSELVRLSTQGSAGKQWHPISLIVDDEIMKFEELASQGGGENVGLSSGFQRLDKMTAGFQKGDLLILAARPSMGKTALALNLALNAAILDGAGVGIYSLEMGRHSLVDRFFCSLGMVDGTKLRTGDLDADDWERLHKASEQLRRLKIHINDKPGLNVAEIRASALQLKAQDPTLGLILLDYLQLMGAMDPKLPRVQQVSNMSRGLKALAKDLEVPVIALSQLSRGVEQRQDKRPMMSDLRESGAIEQDADVIMFIYRDEYYNPDSADQGLAEIIIAKQRNGPTGTVKLAFQKQYTLFNDVAEGDWLAGM